MKKFYLLFILVLFAGFSLNAQNWVFAEQFASTGSVETVDVKVDGDGDIYVVGNFINDLAIGGLAPLTYIDANTKEDMFLCKFDKDGTAQWARRIASDHRDLVGGLAIDPSDNIYVVGSFMGATLTFSGETTEFNNAAAGKHDAFIAKYNTSGTLLTADSVFWGTNVQRLLDVTYDFTKDLLAVVGTFQTELRYDSAGAKVLDVVGTKDQVMARFDPDLNFKDKLVLNNSLKETALKNVNNCVIADTVNSYFITGDLVGDLFDASSTLLISADDATNMDIAVLRVNDQLVYQWGRTGGGGSYEHINSSGSDAFGNIYFTGKAQSASITIDINASEKSDPYLSIGGQDYLIGKYNRNGNLRWFRRDGGPGNDNAYGMAVLGERILYSGQIDNNGQISSGFSVYDLAGNIIITDSITGDGIETGLNVSFDHSDDSVLVIGSFDGDSLKAGDFRLDNTNPGTEDGFLVKYGFKFKLFTVDVQDILCNGESTGSIQVGAEFGTGTIAYEWIPDVSTTNIASNLPADTYLIIGTDEEGRIDTLEVILTEPGPITITEDGITSTSCNVLATSGTKNDGSISITPSGGAEPYTFLWSGGSGFVQGDEDQSTLTAGTYYLTLTDYNSCSKIDTFIVNQPAKVSHGGSLVEDIIINDPPPHDSGAVHLNTYGGAAPYTYSWDGPSGFTSTMDTITGLIAGGDYDLQITDDNSCVFDTSFHVLIDTGLLITICDFRHVSCRDDEDGFVKVCVTSGGTGSYKYEWRTSGGTPVGIDNETLNGVGAGTYIVKVTDLGSLKTAEISETIMEPSSYLTVSHDSTWNPSCNGDADGAIFITTTGGWGGYTYLWTPRSKTDEDNYNLIADKYTVQVSDKGLNTGTCVVLKTDIPELIDPENIKVDVDTFKPVSCYGLSDGSLIAKVTGGTGPGTYSYFWNDPGAQNDSIATDLASGSYTCDVIDANGCIGKDGHFLPEPGILMIPNIEVTSVSQPGVADGNAIVTVQGGNRPYTYSLINGTPQADSLFSGLAPGTDTMLVDDANGCGPVMMEFTIPEPEVLKFDSIVINHVQSNGSATGSVHAYASGGIDPLVYQWAGASNPGQLYENLAAGSYTITVTDNNGSGIYIDSIVEVTEPELLKFDSIVIVDVDCYGASTGSVCAYASGGIAPLVYQWTGAASAGQCYENLTAGDYTITVTDNNGSGISIESTISIEEPERIRFVSLDITENTPHCEGLIEVNIEGGLGDYTYTLVGNNNPDPNDTISSLLSHTFSSVCSDTLTITVTGQCGSIDTTAVEIINGVSDELQSRSVVLFPNPSVGEFTLELDNSKSEDLMIEIIHITGQLVYKKLHKYDGQAEFIRTIDLGQQAKGTYFIRVNGLPVNAKLMIE